MALEQGGDVAQAASLQSREMRDEDAQCHEDFIFHPAGMYENSPTLKRR